MKTLSLLLLTAALLHADPPRFAITKTTIDAGGAGTPGPRFALTGTIGQPDAAPRFVSADNRFVIEPGFWPGYVVVPTPGLPELTMRPHSLRGYTLLAWPVAANGYILQESPDLSPNSWTDVRIAVVDTATEHTVSYPMSAQRRFFRLRPQ
jgi:hypothetical protein